jgi:hypothetical protein
MGLALRLGAGSGNRGTSALRGQALQQFPVSHPALDLLLTLTMESGLVTIYSGHNQLL